MQSKNIYILRHGEITDISSLAGHTDFKVTELGRQQMIQASEKLKFGQCISSPLSRCLEFAQDLSQQLGVDLFVEPCVMEMNFGDWDGKKYDQLWQQPKPNIGDFWQQPFLCSPPNGESFAELTTRVETWWQKFVEHVEQDTLVVTHAGVIKCLLALTLSKDKDLEQMAKIATTLSVDYGQVVHFTCYKEPEHPAYIQVKL